MNKNELFCFHCDEIREYESRETVVVHKIKDEEIKLNVLLPYCKTCDSKLSDLDTEEKHFEEALREYRRRKNLLSPEEIKSIRELYGLSQRAFARTIGFSEATLNRYELGALQDFVHNNLILLVKDPENMFKIAIQNKDNISKKEYETIVEKVEILKKESRSKNEINHQELILLSLFDKLDNLEKKVNKLDNIEKRIENFLNYNEKQDHNTNANLLFNEWIKSSIQSNRDRRKFEFYPYQRPNTNQRKEICFINQL
ncbi:MAG: helix-turn-helix domain-containing protein [Ruminiclostridium sp.]|nr:helix-turn-helix domain-containing protein [Ruminiclostridium sp.]